MSLLLKNFNSLNVHTNYYTPLPFGSYPLQRDIREYIQLGYIVLDKPVKPTAQEVVTWIKHILKVDKIGHCGVLDPKTTGVLIVCIERATQLVKSQQSTIKEYNAVFKLNKQVGNVLEINTILESMRGAQFHRPPLITGVEQSVKIRTIYENKLVDYDEVTSIGIIWFKCEAGTYIRKLCSHIGLMLGTGCKMVELRRSQSGFVSEEDGLVTMHDVLDAQWMFKNNQDESYLRRIIRPLEGLLINYKRIFVKDSVISAICYGANILHCGLLRYDNDIELNMEIVIVSTKGEAIATAVALMTTVTIFNCDHGTIAKIKRVIMNQNTYPRKWELSTMTITTENMIKEGLLDKFGKPNEYTPENWKHTVYKDITKIIKTENEDKMRKLTTIKPKESVTVAKNEKITKREHLELESTSAIIQPSTEFVGGKLKRKEKK